MRTFKLLFDALVRPFLEYASVIWSPHQAYLCCALERVQHRFLRFASYRLGHPMHRFDHDYGPAMHIFNFVSMRQRLLLADLTFLFKILNGHISCPHLLGLISFSILPRLLRSCPLFQVKSYRTNLHLSDPMSRICLCGNNVADNISLFGTSIETFKRSVLSSFGRPS